MKILAFTDLHHSMAAIKKLKSKIKTQKPDILVCAGDISIFEQGLNDMAKKRQTIRNCWSLYWTQDR